MNVVERRTRIEGKNQDLMVTTTVVLKNSIQLSDSQCGHRSSSNGPALCRCAFQSASLGRKISFHAATAQRSRHYRKISVVAAVPISAARTSISLALCLVVGGALRGRCRSNQSRPPATCRRHAGHRYGDWAARQCSPMRSVLPWTEAN
jgi:hypothetical protein